MKNMQVILCSFIFGIVMSATQAQALIVTPSDDATTLVSSIVGSGITTSNKVYNGSALASGTFSGGLSSGIGIESGIVLTTGEAASAVGPNDSDSTSGSNGLAGDPDLSALIGGADTYDASILEFDFESAGGDLFFEYAFASEEYNEFSNSVFNDVFAFFLDGENIALIPGTSIPVSVNSVNGGNPLGTDAQHPEFYNNNDLQDGGPFFEIEYDGFTDVFTASKLGLSPGIHHIKLALADSGDNVWDSAVFIKAGSFSDKPPVPTDPVIPEPASLFLFGMGSIGMFVRKRFC